MSHLDNVTTYFASVFVGYSYNFIRTFWCIMTKPLSFHILDNSRHKGYSLGMGRKICIKKR